MCSLVLKGGSIAWKRTKHLLQWKLSTHCSEYHVEWHGDAESKGVVVEDIDDEEEGHHQEVSADGDAGWLAAKVGGEDGALRRNEQELEEGDDVSRRGLLPKRGKDFIKSLLWTLIQYHSMGKQTNSVNILNNASLLPIDLVWVVSL